MEQYSIFKICNEGYWANQVGKPVQILSILVLVLECLSEFIIFFVLHILKKEPFD